MTRYLKWMDMRSKAVPNKGKLILAGKIALLGLIMLAILGGTGVLGCTGRGSVPQGWSGATVSNGTLFLATMESKLLAINPESGARLWSVALETDKSQAGFLSCAQPTSTAIYGTPAVSGNMVYVASYTSSGGNESGRIYAFTYDKNVPGSNQQEWIYPREGSLKGAFVGSPAIFDGSVYIGATDGRLYVLDATSGEKKWEWKTGDKIWATPVIDNGTVFLGSFDGNLYALDAKAGNKKWLFETDGAIVAPPLVYNGTVYVGSYSRRFYAIDATSGEMKWEASAEKGFWAKPVAVNDTVYAPCLDGKVYIFKATSGELIKTITLDSFVSSSPVLLDDSVIIATKEGRLYSLDTGSHESTEFNDLEETVYAPLLAEEGVIYVHSQKPENLYALSPQGALFWSLPLKTE